MRIHKEWVVKALVVENTIVVRELIGEAPALLGVDVDIADCVAQTLERLDASHAFAVVDLNLPDGCGLELVTQGAEVGVPLVVMSGDSESLSDAVAADGVAGALNEAVRARRTPRTRCPLLI
jgi:DNA-binding response OmpR family regulator